jgi:hypothetical protein
MNKYLKVKNELEMAMRYRNRYNTNNVNVCVHVTNNNGSGTGSNDSDISQIENRISSITTDLNLLKSTVENTSSDDFFETKLNKFLSFAERNNIKSLVAENSFNILQEYILKHDEIGKIQYKETEIIFVENNKDPSYGIKAEIDGIWYILNDRENTDNDADTVYKLPVTGFVIGIEIYKTNADDAERETFTGIKTSYNNETDITTIYMNKGDYDFIHSREPNNKIHVYSLIVK